MFSCLPFKLYGTSGLSLNLKGLKDCYIANLQFIIEILHTLGCRSGFSGPIWVVRGLCLVRPCVYVLLHVKDAIVIHAKPKALREIMTPPPSFSEG